LISFFALDEWDTAYLDPDQVFRCHNIFWKNLDVACSLVLYTHMSTICSTSGNQQTIKSNGNAARMLRKLSNCHSKIEDASDSRSVLYITCRWFRRYGVKSLTAQPGGLCRRTLWIIVRGVRLTVSDWQNKQYQRTNAIYAQYLCDAAHNMKLCTAITALTYLYLMRVCQYFEVYCTYSNLIKFYHNKLVRLTL
jgi:hypothetical protein